MTGKRKCKILKDIRRQIAADNDIAFVTEDCKYQGECSGTCPKCEAEVRYLEQELAKRQRAGKAIAVAGIAATILVSSAGCQASQTAGTPLSTTATKQQELVNGEMLPPTMGEAVPATTSIPWPTLMGVPAYDDEEEDDEVTSGVPAETDLPEPMGVVPVETDPPELMGEPVWVPEE